MADDGHDIEYWKEQAERLREQLASAEADITDFTESSKELQDELEKELARLESSEQALRKTAEEKSIEAGEWKEKYKDAIGEHTKTVTQMSRELEERRREERRLRDRLRDMELDNDEMEKSERQKDSTLNDLEARYNRSLERIALLEEELVQKATLVEEVQRLKDELRDLHEEMAVMKQSSPVRQPTTAAETPSMASEAMDTPTTASAKVGSSSAASPTKSSRIPQSPSMAGFASPSPFALARSTRTTFVPTPPVSNSLLSRANKAPEATITDLRNATSRLKAISASLSHNRDLRMAGSSIPRVGTTPRSSHRASLSTSIRPSSALHHHHQRPPSRAASSNAPSEDDSRPPSRSMMRQSTRSSAVPRPSSRLSHVPLPSSSTPAATTTTSSTLGSSMRRVSRPMTPIGDHHHRSRSPTPGYHHHQHSGSTTNTSGLTSSSLAQSTRRRISMNSTTTGTATSSSSASPVPPVPTIPASKAREYGLHLSKRDENGVTTPTTATNTNSNRQGSMFGLGRPTGANKPDREQLARRASLALGRSVLNKR